MNQEPENQEEENQEEETSTDEREDIRTIIREELGSILPDFLKGAGEGETLTPEKNEESENKNLTAKDIESITKKAVEEAMQTLKAVKPKTTTKPAPKRIEPETPPANTQSKKFDLGKLIWGE